VSNGSTGWQTLPPTQAWPLEKRRDDLRGAIYLAIVTGNKRGAIKAAPWIASYGARIKESTFDKWWAEEAERFEKEQLTKALNAPTQNGSEGK
jgi:hypothetical protein